jgi:hypothetical protein
MKTRNELILFIAIIVSFMSLGSCSSHDDTQTTGQSNKPETTPASNLTQSNETSKKSEEMEKLGQAFREYMLVCVEKNINAMTDVYDMEHIRDKWGGRVGNSPEKIREMIKGIVANKPEEFYHTCARAQKNLDKVIKKKMTESDGETQIVELQYEDWTWTFRKRPAGWKLIEEGVAGKTFDGLSGTKNK